ncbi:MAG: DUF3617 family protein [Sphingomonadaceae bacterium]|nr:DUF3617 family protein [Sphingomonadaceae bacterium]
MKQLLIFAAPFALIGACSGGGNPGEMNAGEWETVTAMTDIEMAGMPEEALAQMRAAMDNPRPQFHCLTDENAANPMETMVGGGAVGRDCEFGNRTWEGGVIDVSATCQIPGQGTGEITLEGNYTATTMEADLVVVVNGPVGEIRMAGTMTGEHNGECQM